MSASNDYLALVSALWDIEQFNLWNPKEHVALAYLLEHAAGGGDYPQKYAQWLSLARQKDFNEFAWSVSQEVVRLSKEDPRFTPRAREDLDKLLAWQKSAYDAHCLSGFGLLPEDCAPDWFFAIFKSWLELEKLKRENAILRYLGGECSMPPQRARDAYAKLGGYSDILNEFYFFVRNRRFKAFSPITVEGISAQQLHETTYLSPVGAYNYLIYLRQSPQAALADLKKGLPRK